MAKYIKDLIQDVSYEEETKWYSGPSCQEALYHHRVPAGGREEGQAGNEVWHQVLLDEGHVQEVCHHQPMKKSVKKAPVKKY